MSACKVINLEQGSAAWLDWRRAGIGGSDAPAILGISPYRTKLDLYREKVGSLVVSETSPDKEFLFARGHQTEKRIRAEAEQHLGVPLAPVCMQHADIDFARVSLDGFDSYMGTFEAKLVGKDVLDDVRAGKIPEHHMAQIQHGFFVTGAERGFYFASDTKQNGAMVEVRANKRFIKSLASSEVEFWTMVVEKRPPALSDLDYLVPETAGDLDDLARIRELVLAIQESEKELKEIKERVRIKFCHPRIAGAGVKLVQVTRQGKIDYKLIPAIAKMPSSMLDKYRGKESVSWSVYLENRDKKNDQE